MFWFLTWDEENKVVKYEKLNTIEVIQGKQKTYSIRNITKGNHYIVNGYPYNYILSM